MSTPFRCTGLATRLFGFRLVALGLLLVGLAGFSAAASAQTAPQLLPYTVKLIAGGGTAAIAAGAKCPVSGFTSTDAFGDGCLATEIQLTSPRYAIADANGNIFFSDYVNGLVRRVDVLTGIVTAVAGGATASPAAGATCGANTSTDARGDGCLSTAVKLSHPSGLAFAPPPAGDLYFSDIGYANVRKIAATGGLVTTGGIISLVDGNVAGTFGYSSGVNAATASYLQDPYGIAFDPAGNLYIADEYTHAEAVLVVNTNTTGSTTVTGVTIPAGEVVKIVGSPTGGGSVCPNSPGSTNGCNFGDWTDGAVANSSQVDGPYAVTFDPSGNVYFSNEFEDNIGKITPAGIISNYAGIQGTAAKMLMRGKAGSFGVGSSFGIVADTNSNIYFTDASSGVVWRVDGAGQAMYVVAGGVGDTGGASAVCPGATDTFGDGCPGPQSKFGSSGTGLFATTTAPGPGVFGVTVDAYSDLFLGDTETNLVREVASGTQFGKVGVNPVTQIVDIHFAAGDTPAASAYTLTMGASNFSLGTPSCTSNSDTTTDCQLPITAAPTTVATNSAFTGNLQVTSTLGGVGNFALSGIFFGTPVTSTSVMVPNSCAGNLIFLPGTAVTLTATVASSGTPTGTVTFFANGTQIGTPQPVNNGVATFSYTTSTLGSYVITATYSGDSYFTTSTGQAPSPVVYANPSFSLTPISAQENTVTQGGTALYSFNVAQNVYAGAITFSVTGLPPNATYSLSPTSISSNLCTVGSTVALSILTQQGPVSGAGLGMGGHGGWRAFSAVAGLAMALLIGIRRRKLPLRYGQVWMALALLFAASGVVACGKGANGPPATPANTYTITITATGSATSSPAAAPITVQLTVTN